MMKRLTCTYRIAFALLLLLAGTTLAQEGFLSDSSLAKFSVEDLVRIRKLLAKEREELLNEQDRIRERGVDVTKEFLGKTKEENSNQDKVLIRVAEYYIEEEELNYERRYEAYESEYDQYEKQLNAFQSGQLRVEPSEPPLPKPNYEKAIGIYDLIIRNFPESDLVDDAYYNKAYLLEEMEEGVASRQIFQKIIDEYPESAYAPEAYMKLAESFFYPEPGDDVAETILKLNKAIQLYKNVLDYKDSPRYDEALYKLGWSYYRLAGEDPNYYTDAILYFMGVVQDIEKMKDLDPNGELVRTDVKPEALEFIAASFIDPNYSRSGITSAKNFLEKLGRPRYGIDIMENMGDRYAKITRWNEAINSYYELLSMYPDYNYAPRVQKKIADAYIADEQFERAFEERRFLFENYNPRSDWYSQLEQREDPERIAAMDEAYRISEEAFRTNINYTYNIAQQVEEENGSATPQYQNFVTLCQNYLENFQTDENAYEINWALAYVLDTRLGRFEEAFTEYIRVSNDYLETAHQKDAAVNAINAADTLVTISRALDDPTQLNVENTGQRQVRDLSQEEKMLAEAYDNFIKLFPDAAETPSVLAAAGALYYNKRQYDLAKKYYKTMVTKFPKAQQKSVGLISLMNSYFFLGQYRDAEIVARKILVSPDIPEDQIAIARNRIGESIYKNGEKLEQEGQYAEAAKEYRRVFEEAREYVAFVDLALFRSARNFEEAGEWNKAIETYEILVSEFPDSKQVLPAYNNIAADYKELEDFLNVAKTNERIFERFPGTQEAENALFNASLFFEKAQAWDEAIRANNLYIATYPSNPESKDLLFENAKYYLKLDDLSSANRIYEQFTSLYPNDPLTVEAFYNRGVYYFERSSFDSAKTEFNKAINRSGQFARAGRDPNLFYAGEANYKLGQILYQEYKDIQLSFPQNTLRAQLQQKQAKLNEVEQSFKRVIGIGSVRSFEAMYKIAEAYEEFANSIANQRLPDNLAPDRRLVEEDQIFKASVPAYDRAVEEYKNVLINLPVLAEKLDVTMDSSAVPEVMEPVMDSSAVVQKEVEADSSAEVARKWYGLAKEKISLIQYQVAEKSSDFVTNYLRVDNPQTGIRALVFRDQVLRQLVAPQIKTTIEAHLKNIQVAEELGLENKYVEESKRKVLLARNILAEEYTKLVSESRNLYVASLPELDRLIERGEGAVNDEGMDYYDYQDSYLMQLIFNMNEYSKIALNQYKTTLQLAVDNGINNDTRLTTEQKMFNFGYESGEGLRELATVPRQKGQTYLASFDSTQNENFQLGSTFFDDQAFELEGFSRDIFEFSYDIAKEYEVENIWTQLTLVRLVELDPATYLADLPKEEVALSSNGTWLATTLYTPGWNQRDFIDRGWENAAEVAIPFDLEFRAFDSLGVSPAAIWAARYQAGGDGRMGGNPLNMQDRVPDSTDITPTRFQDSTLTAVAGDTALINQLSATEPDTVTAYFRTRFNLKSEAIEGYIAIAGDKSYRLYINDTYITGIEGTPFNRVEMVPFDYFQEFLKEGDNLVAVSVTDSDGPPRQGLRFQLTVKLLPGEITDTVNSIRSSIGPGNIPPETLRDSGALNKNRIIP
ncbi:MAG: tetratricopeptide repeat protein [Calditrichaeota bacterium]|nr:tetratricopeptide repeat protein [Calditrichota bacterium]